jgi:hypothetical protein
MQNFFTATIAVIGLALAMAQTLCLAADRANGTLDTTPEMLVSKVRKALASSAESIHRLKDLDREFQMSSRLRVFRRSELLRGELMALQEAIDLSNAARRLLGSVPPAHADLATLKAESQALVTELLRLVGWWGRAWASTFGEPRYGLLAADIFRQAAGIRPSR